MMTIQARIQACKSRLNARKEDLQLAKQTNSRLKELHRERENLEKLKSANKQYLDAIKLTQKVSLKEYSNFKTNRLKFLESCIDKNLLEIFPHKMLRSKINFVEGDKNAVLTLTDADGNIRIPSMTEGGLAQELIGFTSAASVLECTGASIFYFDEAFAMSSMQNKDALGKLVYRYVQEKGVQIIMISQSPLLYENLTRREIVLESNPSTGYVELKETVDYNT